MYADRPKARSNDWGRFARIPDARLARAVQAEGGDDDAGMQQQRHPGIAEEAGAARSERDDAQQQLADDDGDGAAEKRAMDQARGLSPIARGYGLNESSGRDLLPGI
jgi:type IV secretion system protein VirD4